MLVWCNSVGERYLAKNNFQKLFFYVYVSLHLKYTSAFRLGGIADD